MKSLSRDAIIRMTGDRVGGGYGSGGGGGLDPAALSGYATESFVEAGYLSKAFYTRMFKAYNGSNEVIPNDQSSTINKIVSSVSLDVTGNITATGNVFATSFVQIGNIRLVYDSATNSIKVVKSDGFTAASLYATGGLSSLGYNSSGGGGGGTVLTEPLSSINASGLGVPTQANVGIIWNGTTWVYGAIGGGGSGTVTSIATGTGLTGGPITSSGTIEISSTYQSYISHGETAYGWGNHANAGYATPGSVANQLQSYAYISGGTIRIGDSSITPITSCSGTFWGQSWSNGGSVNGNIEAGINGGYITGFDHIELNSNGTLSSYGGYIDFHFNGSSSDYTSRIIEDASGRIKFDASNGIRIGDGVMIWDASNNALKIQKADGTSANLYATGAVSALGLSSGGSGSIDTIKVTNQILFDDNSDGGTIDTDGGNLYIGTRNNTAYIMVEDICSMQDETYWVIDVDGNAMFSSGCTSPKFYFDDTHYLYLLDGVLKYNDNGTVRTIAFS